MTPSFRAKLTTQLRSVLNSTKAVPAHEMRQLLGRIVHAGATQWGIRTFIGDLLVLQAKIAEWPDHYHVTPTADVHKPALRRVLMLLNNIDGLRITLGSTSPDLWFETDACGLADTHEAAIGIYFDRYNYVRFTAAELRARYADAPALDADIAVLEAYAPLIALRWAATMCAGRLLGCRIDNPAAAAVLRKLRGPTRSTPLRAQLQAVAEAIFWELTYLASRITVVDLVPGDENERADAVSRGEFNRLATLH